MNSRRAFSTCLILICLFSFTPQGLTSAFQQQPNSQDVRHEQQQEDESLPVSARYGFLFRRLVGSQTAGRGEASTSSDQTHEIRYRQLLQREVPLSDDQSRTLEQIAEECQRRISDVDTRAKAIIDALRAQHQRVRPPSPSDQPPPSSAPSSRSPELAALQEERRSIILESRERLRVAFGEEVFQRFDSYIGSHGNGRTFTLPPPERPAISMQATAIALASDGITEKKRFRVGEMVIIQIALLNNSSHQISVRQADLYDWFDVSRIEGNSRERVFVHPPDKDQERGAARTLQMQSVEVVPGQKTIAGILDLSNSIRVLRPGRYVVAPHPRTLLNRPPDKSEFINFTSADDPVTFEIVQ